MHALSFPRRSGRGVRAAAAATAAFFFFVFSGAALCAQESQGSSQREALPPAGGDLAEEAETDALLARALSLEVIGDFLWTNNLSESRARQRAFELRQLARVLRRSEESKLAEAATEEQRRAAERRLQVVSETSRILEDVADRLSKTRGTRRKIRILALELSRMAWKVVRANHLSIPEGEPVVPGTLFKENPPRENAKARAMLGTPKRDYLTYKRGAPDSDFLEGLTLKRRVRVLRPLDEERIYYKEGALLTSPLDTDARSLRIWWSAPPMELADKVEEW